MAGVYDSKCSLTIMDSDPLNFSEFKGGRRGVFGPPLREWGKCASSPFVCIRYAYSYSTRREDSIKTDPNILSSMLLYALYDAYRNKVNLRNIYSITQTPQVCVSLPTCRGSDEFQSLITRRRGDSSGRKLKGVNGYIYRRRWDGRYANFIYISSMNGRK